MLKEDMLVRMLDGDSWRERMAPGAQGELASFEWGMMLSGVCLPSREAQCPSHLGSLVSFTWILQFALLAGNAGDYSWTWCVLAWALPPSSIASPRNVSKHSHTCAEQAGDLSLSSYPQESLRCTWDPDWSSLLHAGFLRKLRRMKTQQQKQETKELSWRITWTPEVTLS